MMTDNHVVISHHYNDNTTMWDNDKTMDMVCIFYIVYYFFLNSYYQYDDNAMLWDGETLLPMC
jgi:hypothetical protein